MKIDAMKLPAATATDPSAAGARAPRTSAARDVANFSRPAQVLSALQTLADTAPGRLRTLASEGAREIRRGIESGTFRDPEVAKAIAAKLDRLAAGQTTVDAGFLGDGSGDSSERDATADALLVRIQAALGLRPPPHGPWFPRSGNSLHG